MLNSVFPTDFSLPHPSNVRVTDVEASSLNGATGFIPANGVPSHPVEVAVADYKGFVESFLIKSAPGWTDWKHEEGLPDVGFLHGIKKSEIEEQGKDVRFVAEWLNQTLRDKVVLCYGPNEAYSDRFWLGRLFDAAGIKQEFEVQSFQDFVDFNYEHMEDVLERAGFGSGVKHRVGSDAHQYMRIYTEYYELREADAKREMNPPHDLSL